jgi:hypothetical protein
MGLDLLLSEGDNCLMAHILGRYYELLYQILEMQNSRQ